MGSKYLIRTVFEKVIMTYLQSCKFQNIFGSNVYFN